MTPTFFAKQSVMGKQDEHNKIKHRKKITWTGVLAKNHVMTKIDPIIAVKDVEASSKWYQSVFDCRSLHGGKEFDILVSENVEIFNLPS